MQLQTGPSQFVPVCEGSNADTLLRWCRQDDRKASAIAQATPHRYVFWACDYDPDMLAREISNAGYPEMIPATT